MGAYFAPMQGGAYVSAGVAAVLERLAAKALPGSGKAHGVRPALPSRRRRRRAEALLDCGACAWPAAPGFSFELAQGRNEAAIIEAR